MDQFETYTLSHCTSIIKRMSGVQGRMMISWACAHRRRSPLGRARKDTLGGGDGHGFLSGGTGNDSLYSGDGNDQLVGSAESGTFLVRAGQTSLSIDPVPGGTRKTVV